MKKSIGRTILFIFAGFSVCYGIANIIATLINAESVLVGLISCVPIVMVGGVFSTILFLSAGGKWGNFMRRFGRRAEAEAYDASVEQMEAMNDTTKEVIKRIRNKQKNAIKHKDRHSGTMLKEERHNLALEYEELRLSRKKLQKKDFLTSFIILIIGVIIFNVFSSINNSQMQKLSNPNYIKTTATVEYVRVEDTGESVLRYVYRVYDKESGENEPYIYHTNVSGIGVKAGQSITIYYSKHNPEIAWHRTNPDMLLSIAILGLTFAVIIAVLKLTAPKNATVAIGVGSIFTLVPYGLLFFLADSTGMSFGQCLIGGAATYALVLFLLLGIIFIISGVSEIIKRAYCLYLWKKEGFGDKRKKKSKGNDNYSKKQSANKINQCDIESTQAERFDSQSVAELSTQTERFDSQSDIELSTQAGFFDSKSDAELSTQTEIVESQSDTNINASVSPKKSTKKAKSTKMKVNSSNIMVLIITAIFAIAGGALLYGGTASVVSHYEYEEVDATVISVRTYNKKDDGTLMAVVTYEYYVNGVRYEVESKSATSVNVSGIVGDVVKVRYNPEKPTDIITMEWTVIFFFIMGVIFLAVGTTIFIQTIRGKMQWTTSSRRRR